MDSPIRSLLFLILFLPSIIPECDVGGTWSTWKMEPVQNGFDNCGSCWLVNWYRECLSAPECICTGQVKYTSEIYSNPCSGKTLSCCPPYTLVNNTCGPLTVPPVDPPPPNATYCPPSGVGIWSEWSNWTGCNATCGQWGEYGCPCFNSDVGPCQTISCPGHQCSANPRCAGEVTPRYDNTAKVCYPQGITPTVGTWSGWMPVYGAICNANGKINSMKYCLPSGSICPGNFTTTMRPC